MKNYRLIEEYKLPHEKSYEKYEKGYMKKNIKCPLCNENNNSSIEKIKKYELELLNKKTFSIDVSKILQDNFNYIKCNTCNLYFFSPAFLGDSEYYNNLNKNPWYYLHEDKTEFLFSQKYIDSSMKVLDIGSGRGVFSKYIEPKEYVGLELSENAVLLARNDEINVINSTIESYSLENRKRFDLIVSFQVLEHIYNIDSFISASVSTLKDSGKIIIAVPNRNSFIKNITNHLLDLPPHHALHWNEPSLRYLADKYNLNIVEIFKEKVTDIHKRSFYQSIISTYLFKLFFLKKKRVDTRFSSRLLNKISNLLAILCKPLALHNNHDGQTIIIVLEKNDDKET